MRYTLALAVGEYLRARADLSRRSRRNVGYILDRFVESVGPELEVGRLGPAHVSRFIEERHAHVSPSTVRLELSTVRSFCRWLVVRGRVRRDPTAGIGKVRVPRGDPRELEPDAVTKTLVTAPDERTRLVVMLMVGGGLRCLEVARLQVGDVNLHAKTVHVAEGKGGHERTIVLTAEMEQAFRAYMSAYPARTGPLIRSYVRPRAGVSEGYLGKLVAGCMYEAGVKRHPNDGVSAHALRHTFAGAELDAGADPRDVQMEMGHASMSTTSRYWARRQSIERLQAIERRRYMP